MIISLYDADRVNYKKTLFNLELMKLSSYYKRRNHIVQLNKELTPHLFSKTFIRKDYAFNKVLNFDREKPVDIGGHSITGEKYSPLDLEIEKMPADTGIYRIFEEDMKTPEDKNIFKAMTLNPHFRLSLDGAQIWDSYEKQFSVYPTHRSIFVHDYNLGQIDNSFLAIRDILDSMSKYKSGQRLATKFPVIVDSSQELFNWTSLKMKPGFNRIIMTKYIDDEVLFEIAKRKTSSIIEYRFSKEVWEDEQAFLVETLPDIFKQFIFCGCCGCKILLNYEQGFFSDYRWEMVLDLLGMFQRRTKKAVMGVENFDTVYNFSKNMLYSTAKISVRKTFSREDIVDMFKFVQANSYELFKLFYECREVKLKGGRFINAWSRN